MKLSLKIIVVVLLISLAMLNILGCSSGIIENQKKTVFLMDTKVDISLYGLNKEQFASISAEIVAEMIEMENILSRHLSDSDVNRINEAAGREPVEVKRETIFVLQKALEFAELSGGAFDPTVAPLLELWGFGTDEPGVPSVEEINEVLPLVDFRAVEIDEERSTVFLPKPGMKIDLGGIAKGYIVERGRKVAENSPAKAVFVNAGGDISIYGSKPDGKKWRVAIQDPFNAQDFAAILEIDSGSVATSGDYQRFFEEDGQLFHHIIDPKTGFPGGDVSSVTILAADTLTADAFSTAVFVLGLDEGLKLLERIDGVEGVIIDKQGNLYATRGMEGILEIPE